MPGKLNTQTEPAKSQTGQDNYVDRGALAATRTERCARPYEASVAANLQVITKINCHLSETEQMNTLNRKRQTHTQLTLKESSKRRLVVNGPNFSGT